MMLEVHISEVEGIVYACALSDVKCTVNETPYEGIAKVLITDKGREISPVLAWRLCETAKAKTRCLQNEKHQISEEELMPMLIEDLP